MKRAYVDCINEQLKLDRYMYVIVSNVLPAQSSSVHKILSVLLDLMKNRRSFAFDNSYFLARIYFYKRQKVLERKTKYEGNNNQSRQNK